mmetsp:Transcript_48882/g.121275  ORF Transcript_48882/g.121275 Transcript_48882/m.121275 type:complete len:207 (+) Transcript_48882:540-1160(+)
MPVRCVPRGHQADHAARLLFSRLGHNQARNADGAARMPALRAADAAPLHAVRDRRALPAPAAPLRRAALVDYELSLPSARGDLGVAIGSGRARYGHRHEDRRVHSIASRELPERAAGEVRTADLHREPQPQRLCCGERTSGHHLRARKVVEDPAPSIGRADPSRKRCPAWLCCGHHRPIHRGAHHAEGPHRFFSGGCSSAKGLEAC